MNCDITEFGELPPIGVLFGWLYFLRPNGYLRIQAWPRLIAERRVVDDGWEPLDVASRDKLRRMCWHALAKALERVLAFGIDRIGYYAGDQRVMPWALPESGRDPTVHYESFLRNVPDRLLRVATRLQCDLLSALQLLTEVPAALDLGDSAPVLATALARHWEFPAVGNMDWARVREIVRRRRRDILHWLGYGKSDAHVRALERIIVDASNAAECIRLGLSAIGDPYASAILRRVPMAPPYMVNFLLDPRLRLWLDLKEASRLGDKLPRLFGPFLEPINELLDLGLIEVADAKKFSRLSSRKWSPRRLLPYIKPHLFPPAPSPLSSAIRTLTSLEELISEGEAMGHCMGAMNYFLNAMAGDIAIYSITWPTRATLVIRRSGHQWNIEELRAANNAEVSGAHAEQIAQAFPSVVTFDYWPPFLPGDPVPLMGLDDPVGR